MTTPAAPLAEARSCPVCGHAERRAFYAWGYTSPCNRTPVRNHVCLRCGAVFLSPRPSREWMQSYYASYLKATQAISDLPFFLEDNVLAIARLRMEFLRPHLRAGDRILDMGASFGAMLKVLRDESGLGLRVVGVNPEPGPAAFARERYSLDMRVGTLEDADLPAESFDCIILDNVIEHLDDQGAALTRLHSLLADGGRLFISTNNVDRLHGFAWQNFFADHTVTYSRRTLAAHLRSRGFEPLAHETDGHVTHEGYAYPYQNCLAVKTQPPRSFDFAAAGDDPLERIDALKLHLREYRRDAPWSKRLFEAEHSTARHASPHHLDILRQRMEEAGERPHILRNHTLPPERFFLRKVALVHCATAEDAQLGIRLIECSGLNPEYLFLRRNNGAFTIDKATPRIRELAGPLPGRFATVADGWDWLAGLFPKIDERIEIKLNSADLLPDALERCVRQARAAGAESAMADYGFFTDAFIRYERAGAGAQPPLLAGPERADTTYYFLHRRDALFATPRSVSLDLSPHCTSRCGKCQFHSPRSPYRELLRGNRFMDPLLAKSLLDQCAAMTPKPSFAPTFSGEPLLYPHLEEILRHAKGLGLPVSVTTNGTLLDEATARMLLDVGVDTLTVSIDAARDETYAELQPPGRLADVRANLLRLLDLRGNAPSPVVGLNFVMSQRNAGEWEEFLAFWGTKADFVTRALHQDQFGSCAATMPFFANPGKRMPCFASWISMYIRWNGDVSFCGFDIAADRAETNVRDGTLLEAWNSEPYQRWRQAQIGNDGSLLYCKACPDWSAVRRLQIQDRHGSRLVTPISETWTGTRPCP